MKRDGLRNVCIIAHVDHGKTTLVDGLLQQSGAFAAHEVVAERVMDSGDLEREKGITIAAKNASILHRGTRINIVDTPGHADFGGEVERILGTVEGAVLLVDAVEGPLPQTRFVLEKSLAQGHRVIVCLNKVDRREIREDRSRIDAVIDATFDLFVELGGSEEQCEFPIVYASAREGKCCRDITQIDRLYGDNAEGSLTPLLDLLVSEIAPPRYEPHKPFRMQLSNLDWSSFLGQISMGRVVEGKIVKGGTCYRIQEKANQPRTTQRFRVSALFRYEGTRQVEVDSLESGDIGMMAGCDEVYIGDTLAADPEAVCFPQLVVDEPTLRMTFTVNSSPFAGQDGTAIQSRQLRDRLLRECRSNISLRFENGDSGEEFAMLGRGELQFAVLIETLRREGIEFMVGRPVVQLRRDEAGNLTEPIEAATCDVPEEFGGDVTRLFQGRRGALSEYESPTAGRVRMTFEIPSRGLVGIRSRFLTLTRGEGLLSSKLKGYAPFLGEMLGRKNGTLVADRSGKATDYALAGLEERGVLFIKPGTEVYEGMVIGECSRENDMNVNPVRPKKLTNIRSVSSDGLILLAGTRDMSLEQMIDWIDDDEWIEVTPSFLRIRKKNLAANMRSVVRGGKGKTS